MALELIDIVDAIRELTPEERRRLFRRLRSIGLIEPDEFLTDRDRLHVARAVDSRAVNLHRLERRGQANARPNDDLDSGRLSPPLVQEDAPATYKSPVSGRVVVGSRQGEQGSDPHTMSPLPGQAPEQPIVIIFDGGSRGNPGRGYGSYALRWPGMPQQVVKLRFGENVTNNEAEYDTLIAALEATLQKLRDGGADPKTASLEVWGDSQLVVNQVNAVWACNEGRMRVRRDKVLSLLEQFGTWQINHHRREKSVEVLGH